MARKRSRKSRRSRRSRRRGLGSVITTRRRLYGIGQLKAGQLMNAVVPAVVGGGTAGLTTVGIRWFARPEQGGAQLWLYKYAPWVGLGAGGLAAMAMQLLADTGQALNTFTSALGVSGMIAINDLMVRRTATTAGIGAIVPEYSYGMRGLPGGGMGAIVMEPQASRGYGAGPLGAYGEEVNLGNVNPAAFGTPGFSL